MKSLIKSPHSNKGETKDTDDHTTGESTKSCVTDENMRNDTFGIQLNSENN